MVRARLWGCTRLILSLDGFPGSCGLCITLPFLVFFWGGRDGGNCVELSNSEEARSTNDSNMVLAYASATCFGLVLGPQSSPLI